MDDKKLGDLLHALHSEVAKGLLEKIKSGQATSADFNAAINLLKHDKVYALPENSDVQDELLMAIQNEFEEEFYTSDSHTN